MIKYLHQGKNHLFFDLETTGFSSDQNQMLEIGAVIMKNFPSMNPEDIVEFSAYIHAPMVPEDITMLTGITKDMLVGAELEHVVAKQFSDFIKMNQVEIVVGHNATQFDIPFAEGRGVDFGNYREVFDTLTYAQKLMPYLKSHKLADVNMELGFPEFEAHRAIEDVHVTIQIYSELSKVTADPTFDKLASLEEERKAINERISKTIARIRVESGLEEGEYPTEHVTRLASNGVVVAISPPTVKKTFDTAKFKSKYKGNLDEFTVASTKFDSKLVKEKNSSLYDEWVKETAVEGKLEVIKP